MRTNIELDRRLVEEGLRFIGCRTKKELVNLALSDKLTMEIRIKKSHISLVKVPV